VCFADLLHRLKGAGVNATEAQIRFAIKAGHVTRPPRDGSLRFVFTGAILAELLTYFRAKQQRTEPAATVA
jgi:hypothetical protein